MNNHTYISKHSKNESDCSRSGPKSAPYVPKGTQNSKVVARRSKEEAQSLQMQPGGDPRASRWSLWGPFVYPGVPKREHSP